MGSIALLAGVLTVIVSWQYHMRHVYSTVGRMTEDLRDECRVLTDNMAHDLRTPLTRLSMAAEASLFDDTKRNALPDRVLGEAHGMLEMINTLLDIAQTGARIDRSPRADLDLARLVRDLSALYQPASAVSSLYAFRERRQPRK